MRDDEHKGPGLSRTGDDVVSGFSRTDDPINVAAHAMTRGEPSLRFRQEVLARIHSRRTWRSVPVWVPALAGAAAVVLAVFIVWGRLQVPVSPQVAVVTPAPRPVVQPIPSPQAPEPSVAPEPRSAPPPRVTQPARSLEPIEPLVIEPMTMPLMAIGTSSGEMPIEIDDLRIEPLQIQ